MPDLPPHWTLERGVVAAEIAKEFHDAYEAIAPTFTYKTRKESAVPWLDVPQVNKQLMIATVVCLIEKGVIEAGPAVHDRWCDSCGAGPVRFSPPHDAHFCEECFERENGTSPLPPERS